MRLKISLAIFLSASLAACMLLPYSGITYYSGAPTFSPTSSDQVELLRDAPYKANVQLGEVWVRPEPSWSPAYVETQLKQKAASLGANAVVIIFDQYFSNGRVVAGFGQGPRVSPPNGVTGVAIRYQ
jgi:hypothetical protein